jgi:hypothetical protein
MKTFNLIIAGDIHFTDYSLLKTKVDELLKLRTAAFEIVIVSNTKKGAAMLGERYAAELGFEVAEFSEDDEPLKMNVLAINKKMAAVADACICFWDSKSNHCRHLMATVRAVGLPLTIVNY